MTKILISFSIFFIIFITLKLLLKNLRSKFLKDHQKFAGKESIPLIGGIVLFFFLCFNFQNFDQNFLYFSFVILLIGVMSDNDILEAPKIRLILQTLVLGTFVYISDVDISDLRNDFLNNLILNSYVRIIFITFCFLVLINGSNFIDGLDGLNLGYFLMILLMILFLENSSKIIIDQDQIWTISIIILFLFIFNLFNFLYLGDSGAYLIGFLMGIVLIDVYDSNNLISPYFIALLLWYPAFENLFSIIRKRLFKKDPLDPDNLHLHQLLFRFFKKRKRKFLNKFSNTLSSFIIISYNLFIFLISINFINHTKTLLLLIALNIITYLSSYLFFLKKN